jgi:hypothetical protein
MTFLTDEEFLGGGGGAAPKPTEKKAQFLSDEEFLGQSAPIPKVGNSDMPNLLPPSLLPTKDYVDFEDRVRPMIDREKANFAKEIEQGFFKPKILPDQPTESMFGESPAMGEARSVLLPPYSGLIGLGQAAASMATEIPRFVGQGGGAIGGGVKALATGGDFLKGAEEGAHAGHEFIKKQVPALTVTTDQGVRKRAIIEHVFEKAIEAGGDFTRQGLRNVNPFIQFLPEDIQKQIDAISTAIGSGGVAALPFIAMLRGGGKSGKKEPTPEEALAALKAAHEKNTPGPNMPEGVVPFGRSGEAFQPEGASDVGLRMDRYGTQKIDKEGKIIREDNRIEPSPTERDAILGLTNPRPDQVINVDPSARIPTKRPSVSEIPYERTEVPPREIINSPGNRPELVGENPHLLKEIYGDVQSSRDVMQEIYNSQADLRQIYGPEMAKPRPLEAEPRMPPAPERIGAREGQVVDPSLGGNMGKPFDSSTFHSFNPSKEILENSVAAAMLTNMGGRDRTKWTAQTAKNAADYAMLEARRTQSPEMKAKYEEAARLLRQSQNDATLKSFNPMFVAEMIKVLRDRRKATLALKKVQDEWNSLTPTQRSFRVNEQMRQLETQKAELDKYAAELPKMLADARTRLGEAHTKALKDLEQMIKDIDHEVKTRRDAELIAAVESGRSIFEKSPREVRSKETTAYELGEYYQKKPLQRWDDLDASSGGKTPQEITANLHKDPYNYEGKREGKRGYGVKAKDVKLHSFNPLEAFKEYRARYKAVSLKNGERGSLMVSQYPMDWAKTKEGNFRAQDAEITRAGIDLIHGKFREGQDFSIQVRNEQGQVIGAVEFKNHGTGWVEARNIEVRPGERNNKVMTAMYDYAKEMGYKVMKSEMQTADGKMAWNRHGEAWSFNPMQAIDHLYNERKLRGKSFENALVQQYGEEVRPYAKTLEAAARQQEREQKATQGKTEKSVLPDNEGEGVTPAIDTKWGGWDRRGGDEIKQAMLDDPNMKDIPDSLLTKLGRTFDQGQKYARNHPILNWVYSKLDWAERDINAEVNRIMYGENYVEKRWHPFGKNSAIRKAIREADPDSMMYKYNQLKDVEKHKVREVANKYSELRQEPSELQLRAEGLDMPQIQAYQNLRKGFEKFWDEVLVPMAKKLEIELPQKIPGYFPMNWFGDFRVWGKNKATGEFDMVYGVNSMREAKNAIAEMSKRFPEYEFKPEEITNVHKEFTSTPEAFLNAIRLFGRNSETGKALYTAMQEIQLRSGASKHRLARNEEAMKGYAGSNETGKTYTSSKNFGRDKSLVNFERSMENYIETGVRYAKNKEAMWDMDKALKDPKFQEKFPNAVSLAENMKNIYVGADKFIDKFLDQAMIDLGVSTNLPKATINTIAGMVMYSKVMMARVPFYMAQALQGAFVIPRLMALKGDGINGSVNTALLKGLVDVFSAPKHRIEDIRWAVKYGIVDPKFAEQLTFIPAIRGKKPNLKDKLNFVSGNRLSAALDEFSRLSSYLTLMNFLESAGIKGQKAREIAARNSLDTMVEYEAWKRSPMFREMGDMGGSFSALTTFTNNLLNRLQEYTVEAGKGKALPIASILGTFFLFSGLYGMPFRQDLDNAVDWLNGKFNMEMTGPTDFMIKHSDKLGDVALFGVPSGVTGMQIGGSLGSPEIIGSLIPSVGDPLPKFAIDNTMNIANAIMKNGDVTQAEKMKALKDVAPTAPGHGMIENYFSPDNREGKLSHMLPQNRDVLIPKPNMEGGYRRNPVEQGSRLFGMRSTKESLEQIKNFRRDAKSERMEQRRTDSMTKIVDGIMNGDGLRRDMVEKFIQNGGNPEDLVTTVTSRVEGRLKDTRQRTLEGMTKGEMNNSKFRQLKLLEEFKLYVNEGGFSKQSSESKIDAKWNRGEEVTNDMLYKEAKKLFPGNYSKQLEFVKDVMKKRMDDQSKRKGRFNQPTRKEVLL